jgi:hypothetical protein
LKVCEEVKGLEEGKYLVIDTTGAKDLSTMISIFDPNLLTISYENLKLYMDKLSEEVSQSFVE